MNGPLLDLTKRFSFGVNIDDYWRYAGTKPPKSIIIPHLLSVTLPESKSQLSGLETSDGDGNEHPTARVDAACISLANALSRARVDYVRCWFAWNLFEPEINRSLTPDDLLETSYSHWPMDPLVNALKDQGIGIVPVLGCGYQRMLPKGLKVDSNPALYIKRVSAHARLVVRRYRDRVKCWQIENEPNWWIRHLAAGWRSGSTWLRPGTFRDSLLQGLHDSVRAEDPASMIIVNLEGDARHLQSSNYTRFCDILGLDFYPNYEVSSPINLSVFRLTSKVAKEAGRPVIISETGYPSGPRILGHSRLKQAEYVRRACREAFQMDKVNGVGLWRYTDSAWKSFPFQENYFGLIDSNGNSKPGWSAYSDTILDLK
jgi:hypothetical protein